MYVCVCQYYSGKSELSIFNIQEAMSFATARMDDTNEHSEVRACAGQPQIGMHFGNGTTNLALSRPMNGTLFQHGLPMSTAGVAAYAAGHAEGAVTQPMAQCMGQPMAQPMAQPPKQ